MREKLRKLRRLDDVAFNVTECIISEGLHNLRYIKECHINRVAFQNSHGILYEEWMVLIRREEVSDGGDRVSRSPEQKVLSIVSKYSLPRGLFALP